MVFMSSTAAVPLTSGMSETTSEIPESSATPASTFDNGTYVDWYQEEDSYYEEWTSNQYNWEFGPSPSFKIYHENGTRLDGNHYAEIDETLRFDTVLPKSTIPSDSDLGMVIFFGQGTSSGAGSASLFLMAFAPGQSDLSVILGMPFPTWVDAESPWYGLGNEFNQTILQQTGSYVGAEMGPNFMDMYTGDCTNGTDEFNYYFNFSVELKPRR